jgi:hypothetical protein
MIYNRRNIYFLEEDLKMAQVFAQMTQDTVAKYVLNKDEGFRNYVLSALSGYDIKKSRPLDDHLNPFDKFESLRTILHSDALEKNIAFLLKDSSKYQELKNLKQMVYYYEDLKRGFPLQDRNSQVDFLCETDVGFVTIEFQIVKQKYWDDRALAYVAGVYSNQLKYAEKWGLGVLDKVIGINLLGDGSKAYWRKEEFRRHYFFKDQFNGNTLYNLQLIQYSLGDVDLNHPDIIIDKPLKDTLEFFREAHTKDEIPPGIDENLILGYQNANVGKLKQEKPHIMDNMDAFFKNIGDHDDFVKEEGKKEEKIKIALKLLARNLDIEFIAEATELSTEEIEKLK